MCLPAKQSDANAKGAQDWFARFLVNWQAGGNAPRPQDYDPRYYPTKGR